MDLQRRRGEPRLAFDQLGNGPCLRGDLDPFRISRPRQTAGSMFCVSISFFSSSGFCALIDETTSLFVEIEIVLDGTRFAKEIQ
jgi:hypothetical protein